MAALRFAVTILLAAFVISLSGCTSNSQEHLYAPAPEKPSLGRMTPSAQTEVALAEKVVEKRNDYRQQLDKLKSYYQKSGNEMKVQWVERELNALAAAPRYNYIIEAEIAGPKLQATVDIAEANKLYAEGMRYYDSRRKMLVLKNKKNLGLALDKFNQLIRDYPLSDKIDDSAYHAGKIYEIFGDYIIAVTYYKRTYQWDPGTPYPARYRAAKLLDYKLKQRREALELYRDALRQDNLNESYREAALERIDELTEMDEF